MDANDDTLAGNRNCCTLLQAIEGGVGVHQAVVGDDGQVSGFLTLDANRRFLEIFGLRLEDARNRPAAEVLGPAGAVLLDAFRQVLADRQPRRIEIDLPISGRYYLASIAPLETDRVISLFVDCTEHALAKQQLARERAFSNALIDSIPGILYVYDSNNRLIRWNKLHVELTGFTAEEMHLKSGFDWFEPDERESIERSQQNIREAGYNLLRSRLICKSGERKPFLLTAALSPIQGEFHFLGIGIDLTELEKAEQAAAELERQLAEAQKLESVGRLAGGVAHDFNNLLTVITGYAEMLAAALEDPDLRSCAVEITDACVRASDLTRQLLAFGRKQIFEPRPLNLNCIVAAAEKMLTRLVGDDIALTFSLESELGPVTADPGQIHQVLLNLVTNARDAMPDGGRLVIETGNVDFDDEYCGAHPETAPGPHVLLAVSDSGVGMTEAVRSRIFEPFFTTKEQGRGTGLGLASVYGIVRQSGGWISVASEPGLGATFRIYFPRSSTPAHIEMACAAPVVRAGGRQETILLVEDQEVLLRLNQRVLTNAGFHVLSAGDAEQALELAAAHDGPISLLLTDVVLPGRNGRQLADRLLTERPGTRVLFCSAYSEDVIASRGVVRPGVSYLPKPFSSAVLLQKIREVLDA